MEKARICVFSCFGARYVFGDWDDVSGFWQSMVVFAKEAGAKTPDPGLTEIDKKVSENMMAMWVQFAQTGNPSVENLVAWPAYNSETDQYMYITESLEVKSGFSKIAQER
jgi:carboxylesterase type B